MTTSRTTSADIHNRIATLALLCAAGCTTSPPPLFVARSTLPDGVHWYRDSAEQKAIYLEVYRQATEVARKLSAGLAPDSWGVILDIDETILDNSEEQKRQALTGHGFDPKSWNAWVMERRAAALPGPGIHRYREGRASLSCS